MSLLVERFGDYSFVQALGASFKEVQKNPQAIRGTLKGINGIIYTIGLVVVLGPPAYALTQGLRIADRTLKVYVGTSKIDTWINYKFTGFITLAKDLASTFGYIVAVPQLLCDLKVLPGKFPKPIGFVADVFDLLIALHDLHTLIPKALEFRTDRPLKRTERKIEVWNGILDKMKAKDKETFTALIKDKKLKIERIDQSVLEAALITYVHDKKVKWEKKQIDLPIRQKSNLYSIAFNVCLATLMTFLIAGTITSLTPIFACATITGLFVSYTGLYSFLYDAFNPEVSGVRFNHSPPAS